MAPLIVLTTSFALFLTLHKLLQLRPLTKAERSRGAVPTTIVCLRWALAAMFCLTASAHWGSRRPDLVAMVPELFPNPELLVTLTGIAELAGAVGLLIPRLAPAAATGLALLLVAIFPANVRAAHEAMTIGGQPVMALAPRALLQLVFLGAVLLAGFARPRPRAVVGTERV
jgi:uncharacterized membrane protein